MKSPVHTTPKTGASGYLARRNPTAKLGLLFATSLTSLFIFDPITPTVLYVFSLAVVMGLTDIDPRALALAHIPFVSFATGLLVVNAASRPGTVLWEAGFLNFTDEGLSVGAALAMRTLVIGVLSIGFLVSTDAVALMTSLHHNARLSPRLTYALLAGYRMLQEMPSEWESIRNAHAVRGQLRGQERAPQRVQRTARAAFTLLVLSIRKGERLSQSLESRGLGLSPRSTWRVTPVTHGDWVMVAAGCGLFALVLLASHIAGSLAGVAILST